MLEILETKDSANANHKRLVMLIKLGFAGIFLFVYLGVSVYILAFKPNINDEQRLYASTVLTAAIIGSTGYAFGKKQDKPEKE
ncbi:MAG: hypothetical protein ACRYFS_23365 [Janthinobacterium lividum]